MSAKIFSRSQALLAGALACLVAAGMAIGSADRAAGLQRDFPAPVRRALPAGLDRLALAGALSSRSKLLADLTYIDTLQYIGDFRYRNDGNFSKASKLYSSIQWLDPSFRYAIREGISFLGWVVNRTDQAETLTRRAMQVDPKETRYAAYWGALAYQDRLDHAEVIEALRQEAQKPDTPEMLLRMLGHIYIKEKDWEGALIYWRWLKGRGKEFMTQEWARTRIPLAERELAKKQGRR